MGIFSICVINKVHY
ncbi:TPA: erythromycin resistance leader peptide, partial [Staphylococcus aureus]|nr:erythromycin resistance leader peptide [Staphylococcus aureus]